jgi:hypothetical protein
MMVVKVMLMLVVIGTFYAAYDGDWLLAGVGLLLAWAGIFLIAINDKENSDGET